MLDTATKRRIDTARDILVGKVPDPKSQVEQITIALIYKFMDDMDLEAEELGGFRKFFAGDFARYGWAKLMRSGLGGHETLNLYAEAIARMPENPGIPPLFRDIFKNAYLPYRDPETLRAFLKIIDEFEYDHSERLGDAFEYLLSVLGSQGDAGQFRTPRHIIDFIVAILDPKKDETVLDPACGTAGFLISAWKHILKQNSSPRPLAGDDCMDAGGRAMPGAIAERPAFNSPLPLGEGSGVRAGDLLTPDERGRLAANFKGYDISPDMVRLSLVNLYLHGFTDPHIFEYDTLTSQERWSETADVILANPPFMSPKGGIRPHNRFSVQSKRSEVLFVDYMAEHLTPTGRAGIIVPEGIIFQSQGAYTQLRKLLVEEYLIAVVSLPAGVFQPYSGVKTSILILDKSLARTCDRIAFFKVQNDGFGLGAQRRAIASNDLPAAAAALQAFRHSRASGNPVDFDPGHYPGLLVVEKTRIAANGDYNLSGERYREGVVRSGQQWPKVPLSEVCSLQRGLSYSTAEIGERGNGVPFYNLKSIKRNGVPQQNEFKYFTGEVKDRHLVEPGEVLIALTDLTPKSELIGSPKFITDQIKAAFSADLGKIVFKDPSVQAQFLYHLLRSSHYRDYIVTYSHGANVKHLQSEGFYAFQIPLPPLEVQKEIVAEIEGYQKVIDGARAVLDNYRPHIPIHPDWPMVTIGEVVESILLGLVKNKAEQDAKHTAPYIKMNNITSDGALDLTDLAYVDATDDEVSRYALSDGDFIYNTRNAPNLVGKSTVFHGESGRYLFNNNILRIRFGPRANPDFVNTVMNSESGKSKIRSQVDGTTSVAALYQKNYLAIEIPLPPLTTQQAIVAEIEAEQALVAANRQLIARFEKKIQATLARVWCEDAPDIAHSGAVVDATASADPDLDAGQELRRVAEPPAPDYSPT